MAIDLPSGIILVAAVGRSGQMGLNHGLPWPKDPADLSWFKQVTQEARWCILGHNTFETLPLVVKRDRERHLIVDQPTMTPQQYLEYWFGHRDPPKTIAVIGGAKTYARWLPLARMSFITHIDYDGPADTWMPDLWKREDEHL